MVRKVRPPATTKPVRKRHVRVLPGTREYEIWLYEGDRPVRRGPSVDRVLAFDARRFGQDLIEDKIEEFLRDIERKTLRQIPRPHRPNLARCRCRAGR